MRIVLLLRLGILKRRQNSGLDSTRRYEQRDLVSRPVTLENWVFLVVRVEWGESIGILRNAKFPRCSADTGNTVLSRGLFLDIHGLVSFCSLVCSRGSNTCKLCRFSGTCSSRRALIVLDLLVDVFIFERSCGRCLFVCGRVLLLSVLVKHLRTCL